MNAINKIAIIREKLNLYGKTYIKEDFLQKLLDKFAPNYTITQLCNLRLITPIKRGKVYINNKTKDFINPFVIGALYMGDELYMFGGMMMYNRHSISEQIAEWYTIYNTKISGKKIIGNAKFIFVRQRESFFYGVKTEKYDGVSYKVISPERAFIQAIKENKTFDKLPYRIDKIKLEKLANKYASKAINLKLKKYVY